MAPENNNDEPLPSPPNPQMERHEESDASFLEKDRGDGTPSVDDDGDDDDDHVDGDGPSKEEGVVAPPPPKKTKNTYGRRLCDHPECDNIAKKGGVCVKHGSERKLCSHGGCTNKVIKGGVCVKHGAVIKRCSHEGCSNQAVRGGVCVRHGATKQLKLCRHEGCTNKVIKGGVCVKHGAIIVRCRHEGCSNQAVKGGVCVRHGAKRAVVLCRHEGCTNKVIKGGVCVKHGAIIVRCRHEGCANQAVKGGVCVRHGAVRKRCRHEGCTRRAQRGGVCIRHGAVVKRCSFEGCTNGAVRRGLCNRHGAKRDKLCGRMEGTLHDGNFGPDETRFGNKGGVDASVANNSTEPSSSKQRGWGLCQRHGGKIFCVQEGCSNWAKKGGLCNHHRSERDKLCRQIEGALADSDFGPDETRFGKGGVDASVANNSTEPSSRQSAQRGASEPPWMAVVPTPAVAPGIAAPPRPPTGPQRPNQFVFPFTAPAVAAAGQRGMEASAVAPVTSQQRQKEQAWRGEAPGERFRRQLRFTDPSAFIRELLSSRGDEVGAVGILLGDEQDEKAVGPSASADKGQGSDGVPSPAQPIRRSGVRNQQSDAPAQPKHRSRVCNQQAATETKKKKSRKRMLDETRAVEPTDGDVLSGRGGFTNTHPGNIRFRQKALKFRPWYEKSSTYKKQDIADLLVNSVLNDGHRFLGKGEDGLWHEMVGKGPHYKASQALREHIKGGSAK